MAKKDSEQQEMIGVKPDYQNWVPKSMVTGAAAGAGALLAADIAAHLVTGNNRTAGGKALCAALTVGTAACAGVAGWLYALRRSFDYNGKRKLAKRTCDEDVGRSHYQALLSHSGRVKNGEHIQLFLSKPRGDAPRDLLVESTAAG